MSKVYLAQIEKTTQLLNGLKSKIHLIRDKGLDENFIQRLESDNNQAFIYNNENDRLRVELKDKTRRANLKLNEIKAQVKEVKRIVKRDFPQEKWIEFGINDKR